MGEKLRPQSTFPKTNQSRASRAINRQPPWNPAKAYGEKADFTPFKTSMDYVLNTIKY